MYDAQKGLCAICDQPAPGKTRLHVDHNHKTGAIRGLLCVLCNSMLSKVENRPDLILRANRYLEEYSGN